MQILVSGLSASEGKNTTSVAADELFERQHRLYRKYGKVVIDRLGGPFLFVLLAPVMAIIALAVRLFLGSGVLFLQERVGFRGKPFLVYKFRTMRPDMRRAATDYAGPDRRSRHKTLDDPRHTRLGRFLRKYSLDELPQLWNVMRGEMSLVGPRPELPVIVSRYDASEHARHCVKPGMTGLWQVSARNDGDGSLMFEHTDIDLDYVARCSLGLDLQIARGTLRLFTRFDCGGE